MSSSNANAWASHLFSNETSTTKSTLITDKAIAIATMMSQQSDESSAKLDVWYRCDLQLQKDRNVALTAVQTRCIPTNLQAWPTELKHDIGFWTAFLSHQGSGGYDSQKSSTNDSTKVSDSWFVPAWKSKSQIRSVLHRLPGLALNVNFWYTVLHAKFASSDLLIEKAHQTILNNKQFMIHAITSDFKVYDALCAPLNQDEDIVTTALQQNAKAIIFIPAFVQDMYPDAVAKSIRDCNGFVMYQFEEYLSQRLWKNRDVVMSWLANGGDYRTEDFPVEFEDDEEIFLLLAESDLFEFASKKLRSDKDFMKKAISIHSLLLLKAEGDLKFDFDLALTSYSPTRLDSNQVPHFFNEEFGYEYDFRFFKGFFEYLTHKKDKVDSFFIFLMAVSIIRPHNHVSSNHLASLNQGSETTNTILKLIHEYIDVPKGIELQRLLAAHRAVSSELGNDFRAGFM